LGIFNNFNTFYPAEKYSRWMDTSYIAAQINIAAQGPDSETTGSELISQDWRMVDNSSGRKLISQDRRMVDNRQGTDISRLENGRQQTGN
jgi:hypothetical protein